MNKTEKIKASEYYREDTPYSLMRKLVDRLIWAGILFLFIMSPLDLFIRNGGELISIAGIGLGMIGSGLGFKTWQKFAEIKTEIADIENKSTDVQDPANPNPGQ